MRDDYSRQQRTEILQAEYKDTSALRLTVWPQGESGPLLRTLAWQLHRNFAVADSLQQALNGAADGVLLADGDVELLSTALMRFALVLDGGAELVTCDTAYGPRLTADLFWPQEGPAAGQCRCALLSQALFRKAAACSTEKTPRALLAAAMDLTASRRHLSECLAGLRRELVSADLFRSEGKRALVFSHEFSLTGAPIVLASALPELLMLGYETVVVSPKNGGALPLFRQKGAPVLICPDRLKDPGLYLAARGADFVLANTLNERDSVWRLAGSGVPVLWWLHEAQRAYSMGRDELPDALPGNVSLFAVGSRAAGSMHERRPQYEIGQLLYTVPDYAAAGAGTLPEAQLPGLAALEDRRPLFVNIGSLEWRKGQDIFVQAIRLLTARQRNAARFLFVGGSDEGALVEKIRLLAAEFPQSVFYAGPVSHAAALALLRRCTCAVCSSRDDPMPTYITEAAAFSRPSIVSEHTGTAGLIEPGVNGFVYKDDDPAALAALLRAVIADPAQMDAMGREARVLYERLFSPAVFRKTFGSAVSVTLQSAARGDVGRGRKPLRP